MPAMPLRVTAIVSSRSMRPCKSAGGEASTARRNSVEYGRMELREPRIREIESLVAKKIGTVWQFSTHISHARLLR